MKRCLSLLLALVLLLPGCGRGTKEDESASQDTGLPSQDAETIVRAMLSSLEEDGEADALVWYLEPLDVGAYLADFYDLEDLCWADGAVVRMDGARAFELAVLFLDEWDVGPTAEVLQQYLLDRRGSFTGYFPDQAALLDDALILTERNCVALIVCEDPDAAKSAFETCFDGGASAVWAPAVLPSSSEEQRQDGRLAYVCPGKDDMALFDDSAILAAWESGDDSALSREDRAVLEAAERVFEERVAPGMSDYDKELALYTWLTTHVVYDYSHHEKKGAPRTAYEPYGPLVDGKGVCLGFAETFRLFMDMAGIECITVTGAAFQSREDHAWNMVKLDGEWYCADPTWDLIGRADRLPEGFDTSKLFSYFNVTSDWMAQTDHQWDYEDVPEATAEDHGRPEG